MPNIFQRAAKAVGKAFGFIRDEPPSEPARVEPPEPTPHSGPSFLPPRMPPPPEIIPEVEKAIPDFDSTGDEPLLPRSMFGGKSRSGGGYATRDDDFLGLDDERIRDLRGAVEDFRDELDEDIGDFEISFEAEFEIGEYELGSRTVTASFHDSNSGEAGAFLNDPNYMSAMSKYVSGSGFSLAQWMKGMGEVSSITIRKL